MCIMSFYFFNKLPKFTAEEDLQCSDLWLYVLNLQVLSVKIELVTPYFLIFPSEKNIIVIFT